MAMWAHTLGDACQELAGHTDHVVAVAVGQLYGRDVIVSGSGNLSDDHAVRIWDGAGAPVGGPLTGHTGTVRAVAVGQLGGRDIIVSGSDATVWIWDGAGRPLTHIDLLAPCSSLYMTTDRIHSNWQGHQRIHLKLAGKQTRPVSHG